MKTSFSKIYQCRKKKLSKHYQENKERLQKRSSCRKSLSKEEKEKKVQFGCEY